MRPEWPTLTEQQRQPKGYEEELNDRRCVSDELYIGRGYPAKNGNLGIAANRKKRCEQKSHQTAADCKPHFSCDEQQPCKKRRHTIQHGLQDFGAARFRKAPICLALAPLFAPPSLEHHDCEGSHSRNRE